MGEKRNTQISRDMEPESQNNCLVDILYSPFWFNAWDEEEYPFFSTARKIT